MQYFKIGKLAASHGLTGELVLQHSLGKKTSLKGLDAVFIEDKKNSMIPYFIEKAVARTSDEILIKLEGINSKEAARKLTPLPVWLRQEDFEKHSSKTTPITLLGFILINGTEEIGEITEVIEQPHQIICTVFYNNNEALIPVHQENLLKIDKKQRKVYVELPDGLLDVYASSSAD